MFEPTIKYRRVNDPPKDITKSLEELTVKDSQELSSKSENVNRTSGDNETDKTQSMTTSSDTKDEKKDTAALISGATTTSAAATATDPYSFTFEEEEEEEKDSKIEVDPNDKERIIVTLSTGRQFSADRYCPHAGADLSYHGKVAEDDYPPEIGPVLMCPIHYWEFALEKGGKGGSGFTSINACPIDVAAKCAVENKKLEW
ncbi:hypothetical protein MAM1_0276d09110 [Mucor ambiguus]|uniref:Rieske domain-containing protein n=1 Tax=Mucor ambiguus TaxID=91626 RepID=A0A0C9LX34_9FUNG|nr:hypothetical protein MAM1_0276d09110 [Mucor ambiguus]